MLKKKFLLFQIYHLFWVRQEAMPVIPALGNVKTGQSQIQVCLSYALRCYIKRKTKQNKTKAHKSIYTTNETVILPKVIPLLFFVV